MSDRPSGAQVLIVEDSPDELELIERVIANHHFPHRFLLVRSAGEALQKIAHDRSLGIVRLQLIVIDVSLGLVDGLELLRQIREDASLRHVPIVIFTGTLRRSMITYTYGLGANSCVEKPTDYERYEEIILSILDYWLAVNQTMVLREGDPS
jgi:CheY-like chemotaxis protein